MTSLFSKNKNKEDLGEKEKNTKDQTTSETKDSEDRVGLFSKDDPMLSYMSYIYGSNSTSSSYHPRSSGSGATSNPKVNGLLGNPDHNKNNKQGANTAGGRGSSFNMIEADIFNPVFDYGCFHLVDSNFNSIESIIKNSYKISSTGKFSEFKQTLNIGPETKFEDAYVASCKDCQMAILKSNLESKLSDKKGKKMPTKEINEFCDQLEVMGINKNEATGPGGILSEVLEGITDAPVYKYDNGLKCPDKYPDLESLTNDFSVFVPPPVIKAVNISDVDADSVVTFDYNALRSYLSLVGEDRAPARASENVEVLDEPDFSTDSQYARYLQQQFDNGLDDW